MKEPFYVSNRIVHKAISIPTVNNVAKTFDVGVQFSLLELLRLMTIYWRTVIILDTANSSNINIYKQRSYEKHDRSHAFYILLVRLTLHSTIYYVSLENVSVCGRWNRKFFSSELLLFVGR